MLSQQSPGYPKSEKMVLIEMKPKKACNRGDEVSPRGKLLEGPFHEHRDHALSIAGREVGIR